MEAVENRERLFALDAGLRAEADLFLKDSGLGKLLKEERFHPVGSYVMKTMTWRDLDFERYDDNPDRDTHWELGKKLSQINWIWSAQAVDVYHDPRTEDVGLYWGLRASAPGQKDFWKLDLWTARQEEFIRNAPKRYLWQDLLDDNKRYEILVIKDAVCMLPEYKDNLLSVHIYEAVLEQGIRGVDAFMRWWKSRYGK